MTTVARLIVGAMAMQLVLAAAAWADEPIVYPAKGQTQAQQERDEFECHEWAKKDTGVDPVALAEKTLATPSTGESGGRGGGGLLGMLRARRQLHEQQSSGTQQAASIKPQMEKYDRAYAACLTGRGYSVK